MFKLPDQFTQPCNEDSFGWMSGEEDCPEEDVGEYDDEDGDDDAAEDERDIEESDDV